jgi:predicted dehydrogenase
MKMEHNGAREPAIQEEQPPEDQKETRTAADDAGPGLESGTLSVNGDTAQLAEPEPQPAQQPPRKVRYAVVGLGYIAQAAILPAFAHARSNSKLAALVSGDSEKLAALKRKYRVRRAYSYEQYGECLSSGEIDAVYIALPNNMHRKYAEASARAGIHVLCEKPMAITEQECQSMIDTARNNRVKLMIAYRLHFERANLKAIEVVNSGKIGEPRLFHSVFSMQVKEDNIRLSRELGGGPLYDIGIYCINAARYIFRSEPELVFGAMVEGTEPRFEQVPEMVSAVMRFPGNRLATFTSSFNASDRSTYEVIGTKGHLRLDPAYELAEPLVHYLTIDGETRKEVFRKRDQFSPEVVYFSDCILNDREPEPSGAEGLADVRIIQAIRESAEKNQPVRIDTRERDERPTISQEISRPAVPKQELVKAASPSRGS